MTTLETLESLVSTWERGTIRVTARDDGHRLLAVVKTKRGTYHCLCYLRIGAGWDVSCDRQDCDADTAIEWALKGRG